MNINLTAIFITAIICVTIVILAWLGNRSNRSKVKFIASKMGLQSLATTCYYRITNKKLITTTTAIKESQTLTTI